MISLAIALSLIGNYFVARNESRARVFGFGLWMLTNCLWIWRGIETQDTAVVVQFSAYLVLSAYGIWNNRK